MAITACVFVRVYENLMFRRVRVTTDDGNMGA